jgi:hypothetical protein
VRRLVWSLVVIVALLAILDRVALAAAQHDVAERLQADANLSSAPSVHIHGYPFLTQLIAGDYDDVDVVMHDVDAGALPVDRLSVHVQGAHVSVGDVISQDRSRIRIDHAVAQLLLTYRDIGQLIKTRDGPGLAPRLDHSTIPSARVQGGATVVLQANVGDIPVKLTGLPFGIRLTSAKTTQAGVEVTGTASGLTLRA